MSYNIEPDAANFEASFVSGISKSTWPPFIYTPFPLNFFTFSSPGRQRRNDFDGEKDGYRVGNG
jgi:hypothetical protein